MPLEFCDPVAGFDQAGGFRKIVDDQGRLRVPVVHRCEGGEAFLTGRIPYLKFNGAVRKIAFLRQEGSCIILSAKLLLEV